MDLNWLESVIFGLVSGFAEILPVSAKAHRVVLLNFFGSGFESGMLGLIVHLSTLAGLYLCCKNQIMRIHRETRISKIPKRRRRRQPDIKTILDFRLWKTALLPVILGIALYSQLVSFSGNLVLTAVLLVVNGIILYIPMFVSTGNKDSRTLTRLDGMLMGLGSVTSALPGMSGTGIAASAGIARGADPLYAFDMAVFMCLPVNAGLLIYDIVSIATTGIGKINFTILVTYIVIAVCVIVGIHLGVKTMRFLARRTGFSGFAYYSWGAALFIFILYLST